MAERDPLSLTGHVIADKYRIEELVGEGGFAVVYRAIHTIWNKPVAIKFFNGLSSAPVELRDSLQQAFIQEGALLTDLSSQTAGIVQARDVGACVTPNGLWAPYMVLEWLEGRSLEDVLAADKKQGLPWTVSEVIGFLLRVLPSLDVAHARGVAHRDIKPANLFVLGSAARSTRTPVKLLDFGVAKMVSDHEQFKAALAKTGVGISSFTPQYGAPEQYTRSYGATGPWTDVYAMALVAVEMLTAKDALEGDDLVQLGFATSNPDKRPTPRRRGAQVPDAVEALFQKALAVEPAQRFASAGEFLQAAQAAVEGTDFAVRASVVSDPSLRPDSLRPDSAPRSLGSVPPVPNSLRPRATQVAATVRAPVVEPRRGGVVTTLIALLVVAASVTAVFAASDLDGAQETRQVLLGAYHSLRGESSAPVTPARSDVVPEGVPSEAASETAAPPEPTCPNGTVLLPAGRLERALPSKQVSVRLSAYCLDQNEVTAAAYASCVADNRCTRPTNKVSWPRIKPREAKTYPALCTFGKPDRENHPINCVNWDAAAAFCKAQGKRLPTEAEWEYAASGGERVTRYPWGADDPTSQHLNACDEGCRAFGKQSGTSLVALLATDDGHAHTAPVASYEQGKSAAGAYDLAGNVREWVADYFADYPEGDQTNPLGPRSGKLRVVRGGGWDSAAASEVAARAREGQNPHALHPSIGFRCAASLGR